MKKGFVYTIVFMIVLSAVFTFALAFSYEAFKPAIDASKQLRLERAVLYSLGLDNGLKDEDVHPTFAAKIQEGGLRGGPGYSHVENGQVVAHAVPIEGAGLWGTIRGYLGVTAALDHTTGLVFTEQNETPGLGGRIDETWYKEQFRDLPLTEGMRMSYGPLGDKTIDAVTGATQTSSAIMRILNATLQDDIFTKEAQ